MLREVRSVCLMRTVGWEDRGGGGEGLKSMVSVAVAGRSWAFYYLLMFSPLRMLE
jgi:hypothetical protein